MSKQNNQKKAKREYFNTNSAVVINRRPRYIVAILIALITVAAFTVTLVVGSIEPETLSDISNTAKSVSSSSNTIVNGGFDYVSIGDNLQYPYTAKNWTLYMETNRNSISGVVDTTKWDAVDSNLKNYGVTVNNPGTPRNVYADDKDNAVPSYSATLNKDEDTGKVYMIKNLVDTYTYAYTASTFSIPSNTWYKISFYVMTLGITDQGGFVSFYDSTITTPLKGFDNIVSNEKWTRYELYIEGNKSTSKSVRFGFGLGKSSTNKRKGTMFIDNIVVEKGTIGHYNIKAREKAKAATVEEKLRASRFEHYSFETTDKKAPKNLWTGENAITENDFLTSGNFAAGSSFSTINAAQYMSEEYANTDLFPFEDKDENEKDIDILVLKNANATADGIGITLKRNFQINAPNNSTYYRVSFYLRTLDIQPRAGAYVYLNNINDRTNAATNKYYTNINTTDEIEEHSLNGWVMYSFYFKPGNIRDYEFELQMFLGRRVAEYNDYTANGTMFLTNFEFCEVDPSVYTSAASDGAGLSNVTKLDLATASDTNVTWLPNGQFYNSSANTQNNADGLNVPSDWKISAAKDENGKPIAYDYPNDFSYGIIYSSQSDEVLSSHGLTKDYFPLTVSSRNQSLLYINNKVKTSVGVLSGTITLNANSYYHISVLAASFRDADGDYGIPYVYLSGGINASLSYTDAKSGESYVSTSAYKGMFNDELYYEFNFYIVTGELSKTIFIELFNGDKYDAEGGGAKGISVFANAWYESMTLDTFVEALNENVYESFAINKHKENDYEDKEKTYYNYRLAINGTEDDANEINNSKERTNNRNLVEILNNGIIDVSINDKAVANYSNFVLISFLEERTTFADDDPEIEDDGEEEVSWFAGYFSAENLLATLTSLILVVVLLGVLIAVAIRKNKKRKNTAATLLK